ncbi:MAG: Nif3-like dinuclear metal center hexameric protein [Clostridia bacterium]|nr:Nif3-like dinuclear metal center hexameric protein [Clostridia bacterium]
MLTGEIFDIIEEVAPLTLAADYDNSGLQVGSRSAQVSGVMLCLDATADVLRQAADKGCNLVISHHPLIFNAVSSVTDGDYVSSLIALAIKSDITIYSAHTNLDCADGGLNDRLARMLGIKTYVGKRGDYYRGGAVEGGGRALDFAAKVKSALGAGSAHLIGSADKQIRSAAISSGAGGRDGDAFASLFAAGCDVIITSELKHNLAVQCCEQGHCVIEVTHFDCEKHCVDLLKDILDARGVDSVIASVKSPYTAII